MKRDITNKINYFLDNWIPPRVRDSRILMSLPLYMAFGPKYKHFMTFKEKVNDMQENEIIVNELFLCVLHPNPIEYTATTKSQSANAKCVYYNYYYEFLADAMAKLNRRTDLNRECIQFILSHISGGRILDAAAGRGYLVELLYEKLGGRGYVEAVDIVLPKKRRRGIHYREASLTNLPYDDKAFDTVICTHALEHIKDSQSALQELRRVCRKRLLIVVPKQREYRYTFDLHINFFPYEYSVRSFLNDPKAQVLELGNDWMCVEDMVEGGE